MNRFIKLALIACMSVALISITNATTTTMKTTTKPMTKPVSKKWVCETNASGSSNPADKKADEAMKKAGSGKSAFEYALKHCRDCTKITCTAEGAMSSY